MPIFDSNNTFKIITVASAGFNYRIQQQHQQVTWANDLQGTDKHTLRSISHFTQSLWQFSWKYIEPQFGDYITSRQWFESRPAVTFTFEDITAPSSLRSLVTVQWTHCKLSSSQPRLDLVTQKKKRCTFDYLHQFLSQHEENRFKMTKIESMLLRLVSSNGTTHRWSFPPLVVVARQNVHSRTHLPTPLDRPINCKFTITSSHTLYISLKNGTSDHKKKRAILLNRTMMLTHSLVCFRLRSSCLKGMLNHID